ncbi:MAG: universal stress protein [candidate division WOR-3 bacterium]
MIKQILVWVNDTEEFRSAAIWALELARALSARVYAVYIIPLDIKTKKGKRLDPEKEEKAWEVLYEIEDDAFERNVRVSLLLETGEPLTRICELIANYKTDLLVVSASSTLSANEIIRHSPKPVIFYKHPKEE